MLFKQLLNRKKTILVSWLISYALFMIFPILIGVFIYNQSIGAITCAVNKVHYASLKHLSVNMDVIHQKIETIGVNLLIHELLIGIRDMRNDLTIAQKYSLSELQKELMRYIVSNNFIEGISIYFRHNHFVLSDQSMFTGDDISYYSREYFNMTKDEWLEYININQFNKFKVLRTETTGGESNSKLVYIQSLQFVRFNYPSATLVIKVNLDTIHRLIENLLWTDQSTVLIIVNEDEYIHYGTTEFIPEILYNNMLNISQTYYNDDPDMMITHANSDITQWRFIAFIPTHVHLERVQRIKFAIGTYAVIYFVVGGGLAYFLVRKNYNPLKRLVMEFNSKLGGSNNKICNEFGYLENSFKRLLEDRASMDSRLKQYSKTMRNNYIVRLLKGRLENSDSTSEIYGIQLDGQHYLSMVFNIQDANHLFFENNAERNEEVINLAYTAIRNFIEEIFSKYYDCYIAEIDGITACLVKFRSIEEIDKNAIETKIIELVKQAKTCIESEFGVNISVSISNWHSTVEEIPDSYAEAIECMEYITFFNENSTIMSYHAIGKIDKKNFTGKLGLEKEKLLINSICSEDYMSAIDIIKDIFTNEFMNKKYSIQLIKYWIFGLVGFVIKAISRVYSNDFEKPFDQYDILRKLGEAKSIYEIESNIILAFTKLHNYHLMQSKNMGPVWLNKIVSFVDQNYHIQNINVEAVASKFEITPSYLSQIFKKHKHMSVLEYIHKLRIDQAKKLLKQGLTIKETAERVGYTNCLTLNRAFKRYEGTTPGRCVNNETD